MKLNDVIRRFMVLPLAFAWVFLIFSPPGVRALEFVDEVGNRVAVPPHPQRIIALVPSLTEILFSLGLDERVVGVTDFATYPPAARKKPKIGSFFNLNLEKIISLHPDLIVASMDGKQEKIITSLREFHLPIYRVNPKSLNDIYRSINNLGEITATLPRAHRVILSMKKRVGMVEKRVARLPRKRVFYQVGIDPIVTANRNTFAADLIRRAGGIPPGPNLLRATGLQRRDARRSPQNGRTHSPRLRARPCTRGSALRFLRGDAPPRLPGTLCR